jgi:hypothetical protein
MVAIHMCVSRFRIGRVEVAIKVNRSMRPPSTGASKRTAGPSRHSWHNEYGLQAEARSTRHRGFARFAEALNQHRPENFWSVIKTSETVATAVIYSTR